MEKTSIVSYVLDKSNSCKYADESDVDFLARVQKRQDERRSRLTQEELNNLGNSADSLEAAAKELGYV
jgi:hypothetical protein